MVDGRWAALGRTNPTPGGPREAKVCHSPPTTPEHLDPATRRLPRGLRVPSELLRVPAKAPPSSSSDMMEAVAARDGVVCEVGSCRAAGGE